MPELDPREVLSPDEAENRVLREAIQTAIDMLQTPGIPLENIQFLLEDAFIDGDAARCLSERYDDE
jgi:hypothetical protein